MLVQAFVCLCVSICNDMSMFVSVLYLCICICVCIPALDTPEPLWNSSQCYTLLRDCGSYIDGLSTTILFKKEVIQHPSEAVTFYHQPHPMILNRTVHRLAVPEDCKCLSLLK